MTIIMVIMVIIIMVIIIMTASTHNHIPPSNSFTAALSSQECFTNAFSALPLSNPISQTLATHSSFVPFIFVEAYISVQNLAVLSNSALSFMYILATWASWGSVGSGEQRRAWRERRAVFMVNAGDHWSLSMSLRVIVLVVLFCVACWVV